MDVKQLYYFTEICKRKTLSAAAEVLFVTPQALSKSIQRLEAELGVPVFYRGKNSLQLTDYGALIYQYAKPIAAQFSELEAELGRMSRQKTGHVRMSCIASILPIIQDNVVLSFLEQYPQIQLEILEMPDGEIEGAVLDQRVDLAVCVEHQAPSAELDSQLLLTDRVGVVMRRDNPLFQKPELTLRDLEGQPMVSHSDMDRVEREIQERCRKLGFTLHFLLRSPSVALNKTVMNRFPCMSVGPHSLCTDFPYSDKVGYRPFAQSEGLEWNIRLITLGDRYLGVAAETLIGHLKHQFQKL